MRRMTTWILPAILTVLLPPAVRGDQPIEYNRDIRPILSEACFQCHGPDSASRKANLRLDRREAAIEAGAIVAGNLEDSELVQRVVSNDPEEIMPPPSAKKELTEAQKDILRRWIASGAEYQPHWSLVAPKRPNPPAVNNQAWI
ncbi:c-type cytochrome domain-containing protein, partial [Singulisphaera rosea]